MSCALCLGKMSEAMTLLHIDSKETQELGACALIEKHFGVEFDTTDIFICRYCLYKLCDFHEFYTDILDIHGLLGRIATEKPLSNTPDIEDQSAEADDVQDKRYETLDTGLSISDSAEKTTKYNEALVEHYKNVASADINSLYDALEDHSMENQLENDLCNDSNQLQSNKDESLASGHTNYLETTNLDHQIEEHLNNSSVDASDTPKTIGQSHQTHCTAHAIGAYKSALNPHNPSTKTVTDYQCQFCEKNFLSKMALSVHLARKHKGSNRTCPTCKGSYKNDRSLRQHISFMHEPVLCRHCMKLIKNRRNLITHERVVHLNIHRYFCKDCNKGFFYGSDMDAHQRKVHSKIIYNCDECTFSTLYAKSMEIHEAMHKQMVTHKCPVCSKKFGRKLVLALHIKRHQEKKEFVCSERIVNGCDASFVTNYLLKQHIKRKHSVLRQTANGMCHHTQKKCDSNATPLDDIIVEEYCDDPTIENDDTLFNTYIQYVVNEDDDVNSADMQELT